MWKVHAQCHVNSMISTSEADAASGWWEKIIVSNGVGTRGERGLVDGLLVIC